MQFKFLAQELHGTAKAVAKYLRNAHGISGFQAEAAVARTIAYRPTLLGRAQDHYLVCVEVTNIEFGSSLESFVAVCGSLGLPVKCYLAFPKGIDDGAFRTIRRRSAAFGVGVIEVGDEGCDVVVNAMPLTLFGYRPPDAKAFSPKRRVTLSSAEATLRSGNAVKACAGIYDEIEDITRLLAQQIDKKGYWRALHGGEKRPKLDLKKGPWRKVMELLQSHIDFARIKKFSPTLTSALIGQILGIVPHRNETGHKPASKKQLIKRDRELRTRFEHAVDTLERLDRAVLKFRI